MSVPEPAAPHPRPTGRLTGRVLAAPAGPLACDVCSVGAGPVNEDFAKVGFRSFCVADGVGAGGCGGAFARAACNAAVGAADGGASAGAAAGAAAEEVACLRVACDLAKGGAALLAGVVGDGAVSLAWIGDVAAFVLHDGELGRVGAPHRSGGRLTRAAGAGCADPSCAEVPLAPGDRLAVCTDGVWDHLPPGELARVLAGAPTPRAAAAGLVLGRGSPDDATAFVLFG